LRDIKDDPVGNVSRKRYRRLACYIIISLIVGIFGQFIYFLGGPCWRHDADTFMIKNCILVTIVIFYLTFVFMMINNCALWQYIKILNLN
jgi:hypothetical protein